jgi:hypothetical protein
VDKLMVGVTEYEEGMEVKLTYENDRPVILAVNEGGYCATRVDLIQLLEWVRDNMPEPTKLIAIPEVLRQAGWMPIPKPLTDAEIIETCDTWVVDDIGSDEVIKIVRRTELAHGIGEKE